MNDSENSIENQNQSLDLFNESDVILEEVESSESNGTAEIPKIMQIVPGVGKRSRAVVYFEMNGLHFAGNIDKERVKGTGFYRHS